MALRAVRPMATRLASALVCVSPSLLSRHETTSPVRRNPPIPLGLLHRISSPLGLLLHLVSYNDCSSIVPTSLFLRIRHHGCVRCVLEGGSWIITLVNIRHGTTLC
jgi:hypothetical protein